MFDLTNDLLDSERETIESVELALLSGYRILHFVTDSFAQVMRLMRKAFLRLEPDVEAQAFFKDLNDLNEYIQETKDGKEEKEVFYLGSDQKTGLLADAQRVILQFAQERKRADADGMTSRLNKLDNICVVLYGSRLEIPPLLSYDVKRIEIVPPSLDEIETQIIGAGVEKGGEDYGWLKAAAKDYAKRLVGLDCDTIRMLMREICAAAGSKEKKSDAENTEKGVERIIAFKKQALRKHNKLVLDDSAAVPDDEKNPIDWLEKKGELPLGMENIVQWLADHANVIKRQHGDDATKGMLLLGVPGTGKSKLGKACASILGVPMVKLDIGNILGGHVGDSEHNMQEVLDDLKFLAPCVLFIDEIEKALSGSSGNSGDSGVMSRLMGKLLEFMQDTRQTVFVIATANSIAALPPEFLRNGRFDSKYCILMPQYKTCEAIFEQHLRKRMPGKEDVVCISDIAEKLAKRSTTGAEKDGKTYHRFLTGADIETIVRETFVYYETPEADVNSRGGAEGTRIENNLLKALEKALPGIVPTADEKRPDTIRELAVFYIKILRTGLLIAGCEGNKGKPTELLFDPDRFDPDRAKETDGHCMEKPADFEKYDQYDQALFNAVTQQMDKLLRS